ncbi:RDD family protein [Evansella cellulosilytica]|uniref:RDD domain containing protein n=1 Tax=Evansella cellulosilytica (strain ATCC 21833 / DSM 2522 / FERM P-1141 / JCM 9156 / N-4) TaxID=649639 RepID=E6TZ23_EVAC2|nr:RDD family protein [Evansella cellulosilytica]ADU32466.1 RDD domain containing protein [Evansella cellulosilytica DSM 2522]
MNDEQVSIKTPEFVSLQFQPAGLGSRALAFMLDQLIILLVNIGIVILTVLFISGQSFLIGMNSPNVAMAVTIVLIFIVNTGYFFVLEYFTGGRTIGKKMIGIRVIQESGHSITLLSSFIRNFLRLIDSLPMAYLVGILMIFFHSKHKRLGDVVGGTIVVHERRAKKSNKKTALEKEIERRSLTKDDLAIDVWALKSISAEDWKLVKTYSERLLHLPMNERDPLTRKVANALLTKVGIEGTGKSNRELESILFVLYLKLKEEWEFEL